MKIIGERKRGYSFDEILARISEWPNLRGRLVKTMHRTGWLSDGSLLSRLTRTERERIEREHLNLLTSDPEYREAKLLKSKVIPAHAGPRVLEVRTGTIEEVEIAILGGSGGLTVLTPSRSFWTVLERHPDALFRFSGGHGYKNLPILALEGEGLTKGKLLGSVAAICLDRNQDSSAAEILSREEREGETYYTMKGVACAGTFSETR